jgi:hypothetical protein
MQFGRRTRGGAAQHEPDCGAFATLGREAEWWQYHRAVSRGAIMTDVRDDDRLRAERRAFLEKCGRFSVVTPPVVTLMLTVGGGSEALATSGKTTTTTQTTTTQTTTTQTTTTPTKTIEKTVTLKPSTSFTSLPATSVPVSSIPISSVPGGALLEEDQTPTRLAMMLDSLGLMK